MKSPSSFPVISRRYVFQKAWPIILANAAVPLLGLVDTAIIGNVGTLTELGAIALGALLFNLIYWSFGFLRMGTTGFVAQAAGADQEMEVRTSLVRALLIAFAFGLLLIGFQIPISHLALQVLHGSDEVEFITHQYFVTRIWGAPATLGIFALLGILVGLGESRTLLLVQCFLNGLNIALDIWFAGFLDMGVRGIALGTAISEWSTLVFAGILVLRLLQQRHTDADPFISWPHIFDLEKIKNMLSANTNILIRTLLLLFGFYWFTDRSAQFGDEILAANYILLQLLSFSAFFLDGYAFVMEAMAGRAFGAKQKDYFSLALKRTTELAAGTALILSLLIIVGGNFAIAALTDIPLVRETTLHFLPFAALYVFLSFAAFQLDGVFIGATQTRQMRNASFVSLLVFLVCSWWWMPGLENTGLWLAFIVYVVARAIALMVYMPGIMKALEPTKY